MVSFAPALARRKKKMKYSINFDKVKWKDVAVNRCVCCGKPNTVVCKDQACDDCEHSEKWFVMRGGRRPL